MGQASRSLRGLDSWLVGVGKDGNVIGNRQVGKEDDWGNCRDGGLSTSQRCDKHLFIPPLGNSGTNLIYRLYPANNDTIVPAGDSNLTECI